MNINKLNVLDFEASSLGHHSYPIQVGVIKEGGDKYSAYIKPSPENWTDWNMASQDIHNIPRKLLNDIGKEPEIVAQELNDFLGDGHAYCDGGLYDIQWKNVLYDAVGFEPTWKLLSTRNLFAAWEAVLDRPLYEWKDFYAEELGCTTHDALDDAIVIQHILLKIRDNYVPDQLKVIRKGV